MRKLASTLLATMIAAVLLTACDKRPKGVLSEGKTVQVLSDLQLADSYIQYHGGEYSSEENRRALKLQVLQDNDVSEADFDRTLDWYGHNIDRYSQLYEKVSKELVKRKNRLEGTSSSSSTQSDENSIWPYPAMSYISDKGVASGIRFSTEPKLTNGDQIVWSMKLSKVATVETLLGVEYSDGGISLLQRTFGGARKVSIKLQTDSSRAVKRLFGVAKVQERVHLPLWLDSIALVNTPLNAENYFMYNSQQNLLAPGKNIKRPAPSDTVAEKAVTDRPSGQSAIPGSISERAIDAPINMAPSAGTMRPGGGNVRRNVRR